MPLLTLADIKPLSQDKLTQFVIDEFRRSPLLDMLGFENTVKPQGGNTFTYTYNRVTTRPQAAGRAINTEYDRTVAKTTPISVMLKIFGGRFPLDRALASVETGQVVDNVTFQMQQQIAAAVRLFNDWVINGDSTADPLSFDGVDKLASGSGAEFDLSGLDLSSASAVESNWKAFLYALRKQKELMPDAPNVYLVSSTMYAVFQSIADRAVGFQEIRSTMGNELIQWGNASIIKMGDRSGLSTPIIATETDGTTSIYPLFLGDTGLHGVTPDGTAGFNTILPDFSRAGAVQDGEVEMIAAIAAKTTRCVGAIRNIKVEPAAVVPEP